MPGTVEKQESFDVHDLNRERALTERTAVFPWASLRWSWIHHLKVNGWTVEMQFRTGRSQSIRVLWTRCHFGGRRPWLECPCCRRRVGKLYNAGSFCACRTCCNLRYASQRLGTKSRRYLQALKLRLRLGGIPSIAHPFPPRPSGMHLRTYFRLRHRAERLEQDLRRSRRLLSKEPNYSVLVPK
jgi:hypothetical protein